MASKQITALPANTYLSANGLLVIVNDIGGSPVTYKITTANFFGNVVVNTAINNARLTVANGQIVANTGNSYFSNLHITFFTTRPYSTDTVQKGKIWADASYIYVATANNEIKRAALSAF